jgi:hypothetical protein
MLRTIQRLCFALLLSGAALYAAGARAEHRKHAPSHHHRPERGRRHVEGSVEDAPKAKTAEAPPAEQMTTRGPARLDFDDRLVQGQSNKAGAIFLYDRKNLPLRSMVRTRTNFRDEIEDELPLEGEQ